jgi:hypothetical protein
MGGGCRNWLGFGTLAFIAASAFIATVIFIWKGHAIREASPFHTSTSEEGNVVLKKSPETVVIP